MTIYIILMASVLIYGAVQDVNCTQKRKKFFLLLFFTILTVLAMLRKNTVGVDTTHYCHGYQVISNLDWGKLDTFDYEIGFGALCKLLNYITPDPQALIVVSSLLIFPPVAIFIYKNSDDVVFSTFLFISLNFYSMNLNVMRQSVAVGIILIGLEFLKKDKKLLFIAIVILASCFHKSAVLCLIMLVYFKMTFKKRTMLYIFIASIVGFIGAKYIFKFATNILEEYAGYADSEFAVSNYFGTAINLSVCAVILFFGLIYYKTDSLYLIKKKLSNQTVFSYDFQAYSLAISLLNFVVGLQMTILLRTKLYFTIFYILWVPNAIYTIEYKDVRIIYKFVFIIFTLLYFIIIALFRPEWYGVFPYEFYWN